MHATSILVTYHTCHVLDTFRSFSENLNYGLILLPQSQGAAGAQQGRQGPKDKLQQTARNYGHGIISEFTYPNSGTVEGAGHNLLEGLGSRAQTRCYLMTGLPSPPTAVFIPETGARSNGDGTLPAKYYDPNAQHVTDKQDTRSGFYKTPVLNFRIGSISGVIRSRLDQLCGDCVR